MYYLSEIQGQKGNHRDGNVITRVESLSKGK